MQNIQIKNGRVIDPHSALDEKTDIFIADGKIIALGNAPQSFVADTVLEAENHIVCPGFVELSASINALETELSAALAGGITALACPPDTHPPLDEPGLVERLVRRSEGLELAQVYPIGALTQSLAGEKLAEMRHLADVGCVGFSQAMRPLFNTQILRRAFEYAATFNYPVFFQPQDYYLARDGVAHDGEVASRLGLPGIPVSAETIAVATALCLAEESGVRLHLSHLSSAEGVNLLQQAQQRGVKVTGDITINHLHLTEADIGYFDSRARFEPPLRALADQRALRDALNHGHVALSSAHKPVADDEKQLPFAEATPGASGLELLLPLALKWAKEESIPLLNALARITIDPAQILAIQGGQIKIGEAADLCIFDPNERWEISEKTLCSVGKNTPFMGREVEGRVQTTLVGGKIAYQKPKLSALGADS